LLVSGDISPEEALIWKEPAERTLIPVNEATPLTVTI
jgi:hypothetical protein